MTESTSSLKCLVLQTCKAAMSGFPIICKLDKVCGSQQAILIGKVP